MTETETIKAINYKNQAPTQPKKVEKQNQKKWRCEGECYDERTPLNTKKEIGQLEKPLIKITGTLTSSIQTRGEETTSFSTSPYYYAFVKLKGQNIDLPVIFKIKEDEKLSKPELKKNDSVELMGHYSNSNKNVRKSFTATSYQILSEKRIRKKCSGCLSTFTCSLTKNYDYCRNCELNGSRYSQNKCPECGDGSGIVKFPNQPPRSCKLCYLAKQQKGEDKLFTK